MEKIIHSLINNWIRGVDTYTHNGSTWLIFTDSKKWVIELTEDKTLWYNYTFFKQVFEFMSLNVVDNQHYITKWVEDNIINKVSYTEIGWHQCNNIDDAIENGVKETYLSENSLSKGIEYTIENGVKYTRCYNRKINTLIEHTIKNGVKKTKMAHMKTKWSVEDTIENGVKETTALDPSFSVRYINGDFEMVPEVDKIIKGGVKETKSDDFNVSQFLCEEVIDKGVKETKYNQSHQEPKFKEVLKNGVKITFDCDWPVPTDLIEDVINDGVKYTKVCNYTDPKTQLMTIKWGHCIDEVIENGTKNPTG